MTGMMNEAWKHINTGWMMKWRWREGVERNTNPNIWEFAEHFYSTFFCASWESSCLEFCFQTQEKFADIWLVPAIQTFPPVGSNALLLHAKTSRRIFAIGINLLRKHVSKKFSIIYPFWIRRKPMQILILPTLPPKPQPLANFKKDRKSVGKERKSVPTRL